MFALGDIIYAEEQHCWGECSRYIHFGKVKKITKTGRFIVDILDNILNENHEQTKKTIHNYYYMRVVTPGMNIGDSVTLNSDGTVRGDKFGYKSYVKFEKYDDSLTLIEEIDML